MSEPFFPRELVAARLADLDGAVPGDLGINLAGVEVILRLRDQMDATHQNLHRLARELQALRDADDGVEIDGELV